MGKSGLLAGVSGLGKRLANVGGEAITAPTAASTAMASTPLL
jgi:hypothetical protein